jgi:hypothetical protein
LTRSEISINFAEKRLNLGLLGFTYIWVMGVMFWEFTQGYLGCVRRYYVIEGG